jgi:hypothetical protein
MRRNAGVGSSSVNAQYVQVFVQIFRRDFYRELFGFLWELYGKLVLQVLLNLMSFNNLFTFASIP